MKNKSRRGRRKTETSTQMRLLFGLLSILVIGLVAFGLFQQNESGLVTDEVGQLAVAPEVGALAPDFELPTMEGELRKLSDYRGKPVVLTFMHTW